MDGGFGEAALMGALVGGGVSVLTGSNPLTGALMGGLTGGAMNGISGVLGNTADQAVKDQIISGAMENQGLPALVEPGTQAATDLGSFANSSYGQDLANATSGIDAGTASAYNPNAASMMENIGQPGGYVPNPNYAGTTMSPSQLAGQGTPATEATAATPATSAATKVAPKSMFGKVGDWYGGLSMPEKVGVGIAGGVALNQLFKPPKLVDPNIGKKTYAGPKLHDLSPDFQPLTVAQPVPYYTAQYAQGGIAALANGGIDNDSDENQSYPQSRLDATQYATPSQMPISTPVVNAGYEQKTNPFTGEPTGYAAGGGISSLGGYAAGGNPRLLKGPGDGMSDNIPAVIGHKQPARLADGEFVVPADVVSHLGNGSTDAGAKQLYAMMDKVRTARTGRKQQGKEINPTKYLPA